MTQNINVTISNAAITFAAFMMGLYLLFHSVTPVRLSDTTFVLKYVNDIAVCDVVAKKCWSLDTSTGTWPTTPAEKKQ